MTYPEQRSTINDTPSKPNPPTFDDVNVILADSIEQPTLRKLVSNLQSRLLEAENLDSLEDDLTKKNYLKNQLLNAPIACASVLVAITNEAKPKVLLTRRAGHLNSHAGEVSFPGGKHDEIDGNNVVTALREAWEETDLPPNRLTLIGQLPNETSKFGLSVRPIVALVDPAIIYTPYIGEIERIFWADLEDLIELPTVDYNRTLEHDGHSVAYVTPSWKIEGEVVWGLTGRIVASLLEVGFERQVEWYYRPVNE